MGRTRKGGMYYTPTNFQTRKIEEKSAVAKSLLEEKERTRKLLEQIQLKAIERVRELRKKIVCNSNEDFLENLKKYVNCLIALKDQIGYNGTDLREVSILPNYILRFDINSTLKIIKKIEGAKMGWIYSLDKVKKNIKKKYLKKFCSNADVETFVYDVVYNMSNQEISEVVCYDKITTLYHYMSEQFVIKEPNESDLSQLETGLETGSERRSDLSQYARESDSSSLARKQVLSRNSVASSQRETLRTNPAPTHYFNNEDNSNSLNSIGRSSQFSDISDLTNSSGDTPQFKRVPLKRGDNNSYTNELLYDVSIGGKKYTRRKYKKKVR